MSKSRQPQRTRSALINHGLKLMAARGIHACRVEDITSAAGVAKGSFFVHFTSKEAFVAALVESILTELARRVRPLGMHPVQPQELLEATAAVHLRFFQLRPESASLLIQILAADPQSPPIAQALSHLNAYVDMLAQMLGPASSVLGWEGRHGQELALAILAMSAGVFAMAQRLGALKNTPPELLDTLGRALARGMGRP